jgi:rubrerythrin
MGPIEALKLALSREVKSIELYEKFMRDFPVARDTFSFLMGEEEKHKQLIEKKISELRKY